jgi:predicted transcriptional regulator
LTFKEWIKKEGVNSLSKKLGVTPRSIYFWNQRLATPSLRVFQKIHKMSNGKMTLKKVLKETEKLL